MQEELDKLRPLQKIKLELENKILALEEELKKLRENEDLNKIIAQLKLRIQELERFELLSQELEEKLNYLAGEYDRVSAENKQVTGELQQWRYKYAQFSELTEKVQDLLQYLVIQQAVIENVTKRFQAKEEEIEQLRKVNLRSSIHLNK